MAKIKVKVKKQGDPEKKKTLPDVTVTGVRKKPVDLPTVTVTGVRKKPTNLPDVTVTGTRKMPAKEEDWSKKKTLSDEYKAKKWHYQSEQMDRNPERDESELGRIDQGANDFNYSEGYYAKKPGALGKMSVVYSDGTIHKLGEKYTPKEDKEGKIIPAGKDFAAQYLGIKPTAGKYLKGGGKSWLEWYQSKRQGKED
jgi:hypothetical protein